MIALILLMHGQGQVTCINWLKKRLVKYTNVQLQELIEGEAGKLSKSAVSGWFSISEYQSQKIKYLNRIFMQ